MKDELEELKQESEEKEERPEPGVDDLTTRSWRGRFADLGATTVPYGSPVHLSMMHTAARLHTRREQAALTPGEEPRGGSSFSGPALVSTEVPD